MKFLLAVTISLSFSSLLICMEEEEKAWEFPYSREERNALFNASYDKNVEQMDSLLRSNPALANSFGGIMDNDFKTVDNYPIISFTVKYSTVKCLQCLMQHNVNGNTQERYAFRDTPLHTALSSGSRFDSHQIAEDIEKAKFLVEHGGALVNATNSCGDTPLHYCIELRDPEPRMKFLLEHNANIDAQGNLKQTPLHNAVYISSKIVAFLLEHGACPDIRNHQGETPLHLAANIGSLFITSLLLQYRADITIQNNAKQTPLDIVKTVNGNHYCF